MAEGSKTPDRSEHIKCEPMKISVALLSIAVSLAESKMGTWRDASS
jgi:hypothetical protein